MCGIAGWINWERDLRFRSQDIIVEKMAETLDNRGPNERGIWISPRAILAHRRLIVVDPQGGKQPMVRENSTDTFVIVYIE
ncbi:MAG: Asparagine synthetase [Clostridia bacterium 41_269]|nr:MAG: Asparagine synthetase [Clostridia bacterium 41_269]